MRWLALCLIAFAFPASAQLFNIASFDARPGETTFGNSGQPWPFFGSAINAENYDTASKSGIAFNVPNSNTLPACQALSYRGDAANLQTSTDGPAFQIGCAVTGTFYQYIVNVATPSPCPCKVTPRLGSASAGGSWALYIDDTLIGAVATPNTGSYMTMRGVDSMPFNVNSGNHTVRWQWASGDANGYAGSMSSFQFSLAGGTPITTFTFVNDTGATLSPGSAVTMGQVFRYGDIMPGNYPLIRDATTHAALLGQQWDEISTWRENGSNGSWRHAVWAIQLPATSPQYVGGVLPAGGTFQIEYVPVAGTYSQSSHQTLANLCAQHDFKIHLADVRNQDDTTRDSGDATFRVCDNITNTGRDAPRHFRAGAVYDEYRVAGMFKYATTGDFDPLLYVQVDLDLFTDPADGVSLKDVRYRFTIYNAWENVSAGSQGNAGNPGPAGFANDPQVISYQPQILDGSTDILDWTNLTQTVASSSNPVGATSCVDTFQGAEGLTIPGSTGNNQWYAGMPVRYSTTGTALGGLTNGQLYWVYNCGNSHGDPTIVTLMNTPLYNTHVTLPLTSTSQGTGNHTFTDVVWHPPFQAWQPEDTTCDPNWATRGSTARSTRRIYPALTNTEKIYWEETGMVPPIQLNQPNVSILPSGGGNETALCQPFSKGVVLAGDQGGFRPDLGLLNEWSAQMWVNMTQNNVFWARLYATGGWNHGPSVLLDESTGRIPILNNGPPTGPGGNGVGGTYGAGTNSAVPLGSPQLTTYLSPAGNGAHYVNIAQPRENTPNTLISLWECGIWTFCGTSTSHIPNFVSLTYILFGERSNLDLNYYRANADLLQNQTGPGNGDGSTRDIILSNSPNHYWGLAMTCCQTRGWVWTSRERTNAATFGGDGNIERSYFNDEVTENLNYYQQWVAWKDGATHNVENGISIAGFPGSWVIPDPFIMGYVASEVYHMQAQLHALGTRNVSTNWLLWVPSFTKYAEGILGLALPGAPPTDFYGVDFTVSLAIANGDFNPSTQSMGMFGPNVGPALNGTDVSSWGDLGPGNGTNINSGGQLFNQAGFTLTAGDKVRNVTNPLYGPNRQIDELPGTTWFSVTGPIDNVAHTYHIQCPIGHTVTATCPTPGNAFTDFRRNGVSIAGETDDQIIYRPTFDPGGGGGYSDNNYTQYAGQMMTWWTVLGENVSDGLAHFNAPVRNGPAYYHIDQPLEWGDPTIVVPGITGP